MANDIVFVFAPAHGNLGAFRNHLGVSYLRANLASHGITSTQYANDWPGSISSVADDILKLESPIVGLTVYDANFPVSLALAQAIKRRRSQTRIVFGGPSATFCAEHLLARHRDIDVCVLGEAEETGPPILQKLLGGAELDADQPGVAFRRDGEVVRTSMPPLVGAHAAKVQNALDSSPSPYLSGMLSDGRVGVLSGRGCTHHCQYCCFAALGRKTLRLHSIDRVVAELECIAEHQKRSGKNYVVPIHDDAFTLLPERAKSLCQAIIARDLKLVLSCITRADAIDEELLALMRAAGFVSLAFGLESAVPSVLRATGKVRPPGFPSSDLGPEKRFLDLVKRSVCKAKDLGFNVGVSIILGLPTESAEDGAATLRFVRELPVDFYMHNFLWVFPGTPLWQTHEQFNIQCSINSLGLPNTTEYAYDTAKLRPCRKCALENDARLAKTLALETLYSCKAPETEGEGVRAVVVKSNEITEELACWLKHLLNIGSVLLQVYPRLKRSERALRWYRDRCLIDECLVPVRHHIQLEATANTRGDERWRIACAGVDLYRTHKPQLLSFSSSNHAQPLSAWLAGRPSESDLCEVAGCLQKPAGLLRLLAKIKNSESSAPLAHMPVPPRPKYAGRWLKGDAPCASLSRLEVDELRNVRTCPFGKPIGVIGDSRKKLAKQFACFSREAMVRRRCVTCSVQSECPKCPFPGVDDAAYCRTMREQRQPLECLNWIWVYSQIPSMIAFQKDKMAGE